MTVTVRCVHIETIDDRHAVPAWTQCMECHTRNDQWVQLMRCLTCGLVACCNRSQNHHAQHHFKEVGHPVAQVFNDSERWRWCYLCEATV